MKQAFRSNSLFKFTIIELIVVISIIMILASILLPALNRAKQSSQKIVCASQLKQLGLGMAQYTMDYGAYPCVRYRTGGALSNLPWGSDIAPYMGYNDLAKLKRESNVFHCPSDTLNKSNKGRSYKMIGGLKATSAGFGIGIGVQYVRDNMVRRPAQTRLLSEVRYEWGRIDNALASCLRTDNAGDMDSIAIWHSVGSNFLFCDGHVEWARFHGPEANDLSWYYNL